MMKTARIAAFLLAAAFAAQAYAHAFLDHAQPRVGASMRDAPFDVKLWFTQELEPAFSTIKVTDFAGHRVDKGDGRVDPADRQLLRVSLEDIGPGDYRVSWRIVSTDTHVTEGDYAFHVGP
jgi:copper resistance protein C